MVVKMQGVRSGQFILVVWLGGLLLFRVSLAIVVKYSVNSLATWLMLLVISLPMLSCHVISYDVISDSSISVFNTRVDSNCISACKLS